MNRQPVTSSNLASVGYDTVTIALEIEFKSGAVYQYFGVPAEDYGGLMGASSHGSYFQAHIRGVYRYTRVH